MKDFLNYLNEINDLSSLTIMLMWEIDTKVPKDSIDYYSDLLNKNDSKIFEMSTSDKYIKLFTFKRRL